MPTRGINKFIKHESASGVLLILAAIIALVIANSPIAYIYGHLLDVPLAIQVGSLEISKPLRYCLCFRRALFTRVTCAIKFENPTFITCNY